MTRQEYNLCSQGYFLRHSRDQIALRKIYQLLWNINTKPADNLSSLGALRGHWPLLVDKESTEIISSEDMTARWERTLAKRMKSKN